ncbi:MAG: hypothetical protein J6T26_07760 [Firmicutes bacterium]|nr:hypothetical protein [Bacillota bacterium]
MTVRTKKRICAAVGLICGMLMLGVVRGMETGAIRLGAGAALTFGLELFGAACLYKAGVIRMNGTQPSKAGASQRGQAGRTREQGRLRRCEKSDGASAKAGWMRWR